MQRLGQQKTGRLTQVGLLGHEHHPLLPIAFEAHDFGTPPHCFVSPLRQRTRTGRQLSGWSRRSSAATPATRCQRPCHWLCREPSSSLPPCFPTRAMTLVHSTVTLQRHLYLTQE